LEGLHSVITAESVELKYGILRNLDGLRSLTSVTGRFQIDRGLVENLDGLCSLTFVVA
jgi:hypothetical protein